MLKRFGPFSDRSTRRASVTLSMENGNRSNLCSATISACVTKKTSKTHFIKMERVRWRRFGPALSERWIGFSEDDVKINRRRRTIFLPNALRTTRSTLVGSESTMQCRGCDGGGHD